MPITLEVAESKLAAALAAYDKALAAASVAQGDSRIVYQTLADLQKQVEFWQRVVRQLTGVVAGTTPPLASTARWSR
jgi:hypothetical protein